MSSPCGGCPPCCNKCVFSSNGAELPLMPKREVVSAEDYGCVKGFGAIVISDGVLGQMREADFHPVTPEGAAFLKQTNNDLAAHV